MKAHHRASIPDIQLQFNLSYHETREAFKKLESESKIQKEDALYYILKLIKDIPHNRIWVLKDCIEQGSISPQEIHEKYNIAFYEAQHILVWLEKHCYISKKNPRTPLIDMEYFNIFFGEYPKYEDSTEALEAKRNTVSDRRNRLREFMIKLNDESESKKEDYFQQVQQESDDIFKVNPTIQFHEFCNIMLQLFTKYKERNSLLAQAYIDFIKNVHIQNEIEFENYKKTRISK